MRIHLFFVVLLLSVKVTCAQTALTYNLRYDNPQDGVDRWDARKDELSHWILAQHPEVIGLQEVLASQVPYLKSILTGYEMLGVGRDDGKSAGEFAPLFIESKTFSIQSSGHFWLSETPDVPGKGWDAACNRICTWAVLKHKPSRRLILVMNTHLDHEGLQARTNSVRQLLAFIRTTSESLEVTNDEGELISVPVLLLGDFNFDPSDSNYGLLAQSELSLKEPLKDARPAATLRSGPEGTFNGFDVSLTPVKRIDYVWFSGFEIRSYVTDDYRLENGRWPSDHLPVVVEFNGME